eukprot:CAMPEP_0206520044 /NCGR_PEP_ID=MMETSP0324_2-20121206/65542_1 /ASSEMBLY_ACC=CAM_ASM_000836 /TAXON_ID=2866 /ORGANISM="Crypthecodinium cohnii, Strain Seligo" /LENGTH=107 /DNA_ID=CAMNT_0054013721 /DNA_START=107 /DNA_END=431 /DNA_ORIENTATION=+
MAQWSPPIGASSVGTQAASRARRDRSGLVGAVWAEVGSPKLAAYLAALAAVVAAVAPAAAAAAAGDAAAAADGALAAAGAQVGGPLRRTLRSSGLRPRRELLGRKMV